MSSRAGTQIGNFYSIRPNEATEYLKQKFGRRYVDMVTKYGVVEMIWNDEGTEVVDIEPGTDFIQESDRFALNRHKSGAYETPRVSITAEALKSLAEAEANFYRTQAIQVRNDPAYLREAVELAATIRPELIPDANGDAPTISQLLSKPAFLAQQCRFLIHNTLLIAAEWSMITTALDVVAKLDQTRGRLGALPIRDQKMRQIAYMVEQAMERTEKRIQFAVMRHPGIGAHWIRSSNHPNYQGALVELSNPTAKNGWAADMADPSLRGALVRFCSQHITQDPTMSFKWTKAQSMADLRKHFHSANKTEELGSLRLSEQLIQSLSDWDRMMDFRDMLEISDTEMPRDSDYTSLHHEGQLSQEILSQSVLEGLIKNIDSLESPTVFKKIWKEIDRVSVKKSGKLIEQVLRFTASTPRWFAPAAPPTPTNDDDIEEITLSIFSIGIVDAEGEDTEPSTSTIPPKKQPSQPRKRYAPKEPEPANIKPYWASADIVPSILEEEPKRIGDKVKTRPKDSVSTVQTAVVPVALGPTAPSSKGPPLWIPASLPVFRVSKRVYATFERLFTAEKGLLDFDEFAYALTSIGFCLEQHEGSRVSFIPPEGEYGRNIPFCCHNPHTPGSKKKLNRKMLGNYATNLRSTYGFTLEWFGLRSESGR